MPGLMYECPHCRDRMEVDLEKISQLTTCATCSRPFQPEMPVGKLLLQRDDGEWAASSETKGGKPPVAEKPIMTVHPAMFRTSPFTYSFMVILFVIGLAGVFIFGAPMKNMGVDQWFRPITLVLSIVSGIVAATSLISLICWLLRTRFESLTITSERAIWARGIFDRETSEVQHDDIRNIQMRQTLVDRILGVGRIAISSAGQDTMEIDVQGVPRPSQVAETARSYQARMPNRND